MIKLTDQSPMPFGKYIDEPMEKVPASYLLWLWEDGIWNPASLMSEGQGAVHNYIRDNFSALEKEPHDVIINHRPE